MSKKVDGYLVKTINGIECYLYKSFDLTHGYGYFVHSFNNVKFNTGFGFHKTNKFTAIRQALESAK